jgi:hypothetical protein
MDCKLSNLAFVLWYVEGVIIISRIILSHCRSYGADLCVCHFTAVCSCGGSNCSCHFACLSTYASP